MRKIIFTFFSLLMTSIFIFAVIPRQWQSQFNDEIEDLLQQLQAYNEERPEDRVYAHFDKTLYKPGETIWFSAYVRDGKNLKASSKSDMVNVQLINPKGSVIKSYKIIAKNGVARGDFQLVEDAVGGIYQVKVFTNWMLNDTDPAIFTKEITVQKTILPRLKMELDFEKEAYGAKDKVTAELKLNDNTNKALKNHKFEYVVNLGGNKFITKTGTTGEDGEAKVDFELPEDLKTNDGLVNIQIKYQGQTESISRKVPIVLNKIALNLFPEGGDLVNGLTSKVAFKAVNEFGKAADIEGEIINSAGKKITSFSSYHFGMGAFTFTPQASEKYQVKITKPVGITQTFDVPKALDTGYVLEIREITKKQIRLNIHSTQTEELYLIGNVRGHKYFSTGIKVEAGENQLTIPTRFFPIGVAHFTLFDNEGIERAERLAFVNKDKQLKIDIKTNKEKYLPREKVKMTIKVSDENGRAVPANLSLSVVDDQLLTYADDKSSNILSWILMEADLKGTIQEPNFYFDKTEKKADKALDYLLMTAGWRRFTWKEIREKNTPKIFYRSEKAELQGIVQDGTTRAFLKGVTVQLGELTTITNEKGEYKFRGFELVDNLQIVFSQKGYFSKYRSVQRYSNRFHTFLYPKKAKEQTKLSVTTTTTETSPNPLADKRLQTQPKNTTQTDIAIPRTSTSPPPPPVVPPVIEEVPNETLEEDISFEDVSFDEDELLDSETFEDDEEEEPPIFEDDEEEEESFDQIFTIVEEMPSFPGCHDLTSQEERRRCTEKELLKFVYSNLKYPAIARENGIEGLIVVQFVVETNGTLDDFRVLRGIGAGCGEEVIRVLRLMNDFSRKWKPGEQRGRPVPVRYNLPIRFKLSQTPQMMADKLNSAAGKRNTIARRVSLPNAFYRAREFAAPIYDKDEPVIERKDFRSTIYWNGNVQIGTSGQTTLEFYTSDVVTSFRIAAEGFGTNGLVGRTEQKFYTQLPFSLSAKLPVEVVTEDILSIPLTLVNNTNKTISGNLSYDIPKGLKPIHTLPKLAFLDKGQAKTEYLQFKVMERNDTNTLSIRFESNGFSDAISKDLTIVSRGFPSIIERTGEAMRQTHSFELKNTVDGSITAQVTAYPSVLSNLMGGVEGMLKEPYGCFEQTSSVTYPNVLALQYLIEGNKAKPDFTKKAKDLIRRGYHRLLTFECKDGGFEWFGRSPAHEVLTAYGLMEFVDMQEVVDFVDPDLIDRTADWLLSRRAGDGLFKTNKRTWKHSKPELMSLYITWALTEAGYTDIDTEINFAYQRANSSQNPYELALAANLLFNANKPTKAQQLVQRLSKMQTEEGYFTNNSDNGSAIGSRGRTSKIETAALAILAILKSEQPSEMQLKKAVDYLKSKRNSYGSFYSTQGTVLALRALIDYTKYTKKTEEAGTIDVYANGKKVKTFNYPKSYDQPIVLKGLENHLTNHSNEIEVIYSNTQKPLPYTIGVNYMTRMPPTSSECPLTLSTKLKNTHLKVGETVRLNVALKNTVEAHHSTPMVIVGLPAGLSVQSWQLKELQEQDVFDYYEVRGNNLIVYYRSLAPNEVKQINLDLKAELAGTFDAPASNAYLYYYNEHKFWTALDRIKVSAN